MSCSGFTASKSADKSRTYTFPDPPQYPDLIGYAATAVIAEEQGSTPLLTLTATPTFNGSSAVINGQVVRLFFDRLDLQALPNGDPVSDPWVGMMEVRITSPTGIVTLVERTTLILEKGI